MMGTRNPNHRNFFTDKPVIARPDEEELQQVIIEEDKITEEYLYSLNKKEQINLLKEIGYSKSDIKKLKKEKERVDELFKHVGVE